MINVFHIATDGYFCKPLAIATNGYISLCNVVTPEIPVTIPFKKLGGGTGKKRSKVIPIQYKDPAEYRRLLNQQILREEKEILIIIKTFLKCQ